MQLLVISGTIGKDAELRHTGSGDAVAGFSVAVDNGKDKNGNRRDSTWFDASLWGKRGEGLAQYLTKGTRVSIQGIPTVRVHNDKAYLGVNVREITLLGGGQERNQGTSQGGQRQAYGQDGPAQDFDLDDEIPF